MKSNRNPDYPIADEEIDIYSVDTRIWDRVKTYLDGLGGDSGSPHTHDIYADKQHEHEHNHDGDYAPSTHQHPHDHPHDHDGSYAPSGHTHDLSHTHDEFAGKDHTHDLTHGHEEYADAQALADHLANHPSGGGEGGYDDTALKARVSQNETDIAGLDAEIISTNQNVSANTTAIAGKADADHTHGDGGGSGGSGNLFHGEFAVFYDRPQTSTIIRFDTDANLYSTNALQGVYAYNSSINFPFATFTLGVRVQGNYFLWLRANTPDAFPNTDTELPPAMGPMVSWETYGTTSVGPFFTPIHFDVLEFASTAQKQALMSVVSKGTKDAGDGGRLAYLSSGTQGYLFPLKKVGGTGSSAEPFDKWNINNAFRIKGTNEWVVELMTMKGWNADEPLYRAGVIQSPNIPEQSTRSSVKPEVVCESVFDYWEAEQNG